MSSRNKPEQKLKELPDIISDPSTKKSYLRGKFLGKGGFAKCYELTDTITKEIFAGKIVSKSLLQKQHQKEKMSQEIAIHRSLNHKHIVGFHSFFEDRDYVYIVLELCRRRSMMELHKRRKTITEPETKYYLKQIILACKYLHDSKVIHRDLKLGNLFLNDEMEVKIGDFGLATKIDYIGERKKTFCGTPNYIAPEVLGKKGHSFEVDVWSIGCIVYTMLVGRPPFETTSLKDTYSLIKRNEYHIPSRVSAIARKFIEKLLRSDPALRPNVDQILNDEFLCSGYLPFRLPTSCLTVAPRFSQQVLLNSNTTSNSAKRPPLTEVNNGEGGKVAISKSKSVGAPGKLQTVPEADVLCDENKEKSSKPMENDQKENFLPDLYYQLNTLIHSKPSDRPLVTEDEAEDPAACPMLWVSKWVDYSDKYGLGYQLCDNSVGVLFNDSTRMILQADGLNIHCIERNGAEHYHRLDVFPYNLNKKVTLLKYFRNYMNEHLLTAGDTMTPRDGDELSRLPYLKNWFRTRSAIVLHLNNGILQINFFQDHTKLILCPVMGAVTYIDEKREFRTFKISLIEKYGCSRDLSSRLRYALAMVERLMSAKSAASSNTGTVKTTVAKSGQSKTTVEASS